MAQMTFPALTDAQVQQLDFNNANNSLLALSLLQNLPVVQVTDIITAGATDTTVDDYVFVAPCKLQILDAQFITTTVQTGAGNTPTVSLRAGAANEVGNTGAISLGGAVGDAAELTLDPTKTTVAAGTKLVLRAVNPAGTITVPLAGKLQFIWNAIP